MDMLNGHSTALTGMIRLPALLTHGDTLSDIECAELEISMCEPLHDLKNVISIILDEMPSQIESIPLRQSITDFCVRLTGNPNLHFLNCSMLINHNSVPHSKNEPTTLAKITVAATRKLLCTKFGLTHRYELFRMFMIWS